MNFTFTVRFEWVGRVEYAKAETSRSASLVAEALSKLLSREVSIWSGTMKLETWLDGMLVAPQI